MRVDILNFNVNNIIDLMCPNPHFKPVWVAYLKTIGVPVQSIIDKNLSKLINIESATYYDGTIAGLNCMLNDYYDNTLRRIYIKNNIVPESDDVYLLGEIDGTPLDVYLLGEVEPNGKDIYLKNELSEGIGTFSVYIPSELYYTMNQNTFAEITKKIEAYKQFDKTFSIQKYE